MKYALSIFIGIFYLLTLLPSVQMFFSPFPKKSISGIGRIDRRVPKPSTERIFSGKFQKSMENWFTKNTGFWGVFVRTENQINVSLFKQASTTYGNEVVLGKDKTLYRHKYLSDYNRKNLVSLDKLESRARNLKTLQDLLAKRGVPLLFMIAPTKPSFHTPQIPSEHQVLKQRKQGRNYDHFVKLLKQYKVEYLDARKYFLDRLEDYPHGVFAKTGSHWNDIAICDMSRVLLANLEKRIKKNLIDFSCRPIKIKENPLATDTDLLMLLNVWNKKPLLSPVPYPKTKVIKSGGEYYPDLLFVGDSFLFGILRFFDFHKVYRKRNLFFYYRTNMEFPSMRRDVIQRAHINWERDIFSKDAIIVEINESEVQFAGYNFVQDAIEALDPSNI